MDESPHLEIELLGGLDIRQVTGAGDDDDLGSRDTGVEIPGHRKGRSLIELSIEQESGNPDLRQDATEVGFRHRVRHRPVSTRMLTTRIVHPYVDQLVD